MKCAYDFLKLIKIWRNKNGYKKLSWIYRDFNGQIRIDRQKLYCHMKEHLKLKITDAGNIYLLEW